MKLKVSTTVNERKSINWKPREKFSALRERTASHFADRILLHNFNITKKA
jgi:hypothetical protein